ncbi:MAG: 50S ribosomal protein L25 [bacterium]|nr:50S ribosomal protein L25 [bacterium]
MNLQLTATPRSISKQERASLRQADMIPAVVYGHSITNENVAVPRPVFEKAYQTAGESTLITLDITGKKPVQVLIQDVDRHPTSGAILHVDFYQVRMDEEITNDVPLVFIGESAAVKALGGILVKNLSTLRVKCLPADLPHEITVDITALENFESRLTVADIVVPPKVEVLAKPEEIIAVVEPPRSEAELKALDEKVEENVEAVQKVVEEKKPEDIAEEVAEPKEAKKEVKKEAKDKKEK